MTPRDPAPPAMLLLASLGPLMVVAAMLAGGM